MATADKITEVRNLRAFAASLRGAVQRWHEKYADKNHYDKQSFCFAPNTDRGTAAFTANLMFDAYVGTYGNSSVSNAWRLDSEMARRYFYRALNQHAQTIFDSMAKYAEDDAAKAVGEARTQLAAIQAMLDEAQPVNAEAA